MSEHIRHHLEKIEQGAWLAGDAYPEGFDDSHPLVRQVHGALAGWKVLHDVVAGVDPALPEDRRADTINAAHLKADGVRRAARLAVDATAKRHADAVRAFDNPPPADAPQVMLDIEARREYREAPPELRAQWDHAMADGRDDALLASLARGERGPQADMAKGVYRARQRMLYPDKAANIQRQGALVEWSRGWLAQIGDVSDRGVRAGVLTPLALLIEN